MTRDNHLHHYGDYAITNWRLNLKLSISILLISVLLPLLLVGCGRIVNTLAHVKK